MKKTLDFRKQSCLSSFIVFANGNFYQHNLEIEKTSDLEMKNFFNILTNPRVGQLKSINELRQICEGYLLFMDYVDNGINKDLFLNNDLIEFERIKEMVEGNGGDVKGDALKIEMFNYLKLNNTLK